MGVRSKARGWVPSRPRGAPGEPLEGLVVRMFGERGRGPWVTGCRAGNGTCAEAQDGGRPGAVTVVCAAESRRPRGTASEAAREPRLPRTPRMRVTRSLTVRAEVFRRVAETPRLWHGADAPVRPACPEAGGWAVRPTDTRGQAAPPPGAASLCREDRSRSPPPALPAPPPGLSLLCARPVSPSVGCGLHQGSTEHEPRGVPSGKVSVAEGTPQTPSPLWGSHATVA